MFMTNKWLGRSEMHENVSNNFQIFTLLPCHSTIIIAQLNFMCATTRVNFILPSPNFLPLFCSLLWSTMSEKLFRKHCKRSHVNENYHISDLEDIYWAILSSLFAFAVKRIFSRDQFRIYWITQKLLMNVKSIFWKSQFGAVFLIIFMRL
jgi:hypothetical protein